MVKKKTHLENDYLKKQAKKLREEKKLQKALEKEKLEVERLIAEEESKPLLLDKKPAKKYIPKNKKCGIYRLYNKVNGKSYIGQSVNIASRKSQHLSQLRKGIHPKPNLQQDFTELGEKAFELEILCLCPKEMLDQKEIEYHNLFNKGAGLYSKYSRWMNIPFYLIETVERLITIKK